MTLDDQDGRCGRRSRVASSIERITKGTDDHGTGVLLLRAFQQFPARGLSRDFPGRSVCSLRSGFEARDLLSLTDPESMKTPLDTRMSQERTIYSKSGLRRNETASDHAN